MYYPIAMYPLLNESKQVSGYRIFCASKTSYATSITNYRVKSGVGDFAHGVFAFNLNVGLPVSGLLSILNAIKDCFYVDLRTRQAEHLGKEVWGINLSTYPRLMVSEDFGVPCKAIYNYSKIAYFYDYFKLLYPSISISPCVACETDYGLQADICGRDIVCFTHDSLGCASQPLFWLDNSDIKLDVGKFQQYNNLCYVCKKETSYLVLFEGMKRHQRLELADGFFTGDARGGAFALTRDVISATEILHYTMRFNTYSGCWRVDKDSITRRQIVGYKEA